MIDRQQLMSLAMDNSPESRGQLAGSMIPYLEGTAPEPLSDGERVAVLQILADIIADTEAEIRAAIARNIADMADAPHALVTFLAKDESLIAKPVIENSPVLRDEDLIDIARWLSQEHRMAITRRDVVPALVCDELVDKGEASVIASLLDNPKADIASATYDWLVEESRMVQRYRERLVQRDDLPHAAATRLYLWVDWNMRRQLMAKFSLDQAQMDRLLDRSKSLLTNEDPAGKGNWSAAQRLLTTLHDHNLLSNGLMISSIESGHVALFLAHVMKKTGLRRAILQRALFLNNFASLVIIGRGLDMTDTEILRLEKAITALAFYPVMEDRDQQLFDATLARIGQDDAKRVIALWRDGASWLSALHDVNVTLH